jgi:hypothetical protein
MMHPTNEEWMSYLYDELETGEQGRLKTHLENCRECQARVATWRNTMCGLNAWELPATQPQRVPVWGYVKWAAAAMLMLGVGYGFARVTAPAPDLAAIRAAMEPEIRKQIDQATTAAIITAKSETHRLVAELAKQTEAKQQEDNQAVADILQRLESKRASEMAHLRKDLETLAVNAEGSLENAQQQIVQLASFNQPSGSYSSPADNQK